MLRATPTLPTPKIITTPTVVPKRSFPQDRRLVKIHVPDVIAAPRVRKFSAKVT